MAHLKINSKGDKFVNKIFNKRLSLIFFLLSYVALALPTAICCAAQVNNLASLVNPFIGTVMSFTFPGASLPHGMVQISPDMPRLELITGGGAPGASYLYTPKCKFIDGFSMTHLSGTGCWNYGDIFFTATTGPVRTIPKLFGFQFSHKQETATPGYYRVFMKTWGINAQMTATLRCGMIKFTFPPGKSANILVPISHVMGDYYENLNMPHSCYVHFINDHTLVGFVTSRVFATAWPPVRVYFVMQADRPWKMHGVWKSEKALRGTNQLKVLPPGFGKLRPWRAGILFPGSNTVTAKSELANIGAYMTFPVVNARQVVKLRVAISYVSIKGAENNLRSEIHGWDFSIIRRAAHIRWNQALGAITLRGGSISHRICFYTALYHALLAPNVFDDVDGRYIGYDNKIHHVPTGHAHIYANLSGWDIYRTEIPLLCLIAPQTTEDIAQSIVEMYKQAGFIASWPAANRAGNGMNGEPMTVSLAHIWESGLHRFDMKIAFKGMLAQARRSYVQFTTDSNVAKDEECDIAYAALARLARSFKDTRQATCLAEWAEQYREMFNPATNFMQPRLPDGRWLPRFNPSLYDSVHYEEGTAWEYLWLVPQDIQGLIELMGGDQPFCKKLTDFFNRGHYDPTNEPDIEAPFLYDYACAPWQTQRIVSNLADTDYTNNPDGLARGGQDDCGTMSAWYVLSQMGFYPVDPGIPDMEVCTPRFRKITIHLKTPYHGKRFIIEAPEANSANIYIQSASLNGQPLTRPWFPERTITDGGLWRVVVAPHPNKTWGFHHWNVPPSMSVARDSQ
ncbi:MAG: GH92 family glycosyl hydrolase [Planctomycetes bacterium]|nr:GH92 family glycosyl hydrolase [Planctomycetota bacterium]